MVNTIDIFPNYIFLGQYKERRYLAELNDYRDLVVISQAETELIKNLLRYRLQLKKGGDFGWIGIGGPEGLEDSSEHYLWVQLKNVPFGHFWFQIKKISIQSNEVSFKIKCIRELKMEDYKGADLETNTKSDENISGESEKDPFKLNLYLAGELFYSNFKNLIKQIGSQLTLETFIIVSRFFYCIALILVIEGCHAINNLGLFTLRFLEVFSHLIEVMTPLFIHSLNCVTQIIGHCFALLYVTFGNRTLKRPKTPEREFGHYPMRQLHYR